MPFTYLTPEEQAVLAPLLALLDGLRRRDQAAMLAQVMPEGGSTIIREGRVLHYSLEICSDLVYGGVEAGD
jgi:hypothetical protein